MIMIMLLKVVKYVGKDVNVMDRENRVEAFMKDLEQLTKKHGIVIDACGCCGSPWVEDMETHEMLASHLYYEEDGTFDYKFV